MVRIRPGITCFFGLLVALVAAPCGAQENLDSGKTPAQLFASDCAICHKTPQGLAKGGGMFGLDDFLRQHYTASRESAAAIAVYLQAIGNAPGAATKRAAKGDERRKAGEKKPATGKPGDAKAGAATPPEAKPSEPKSSESKSSEPKSAEPSAAPSSEAKPAEPKPSEPKPAEGSKPDKSD